ncbi:MAG: dTMP kinase [Desulfarculales bacterium]|nr:dTMP kinase [Desulfarculales bacterium]
MRGLFITLEGGEGVGKSTQLGWLQNKLTRAGWPVQVSREPGGSELGSKLRQIVLRDAMTPKAELLIYLADRIQHAEEKLLPWLRQKQIVLCDRFVDSCEVYQGISRGLGQPLVRRLHRLLLPPALWPGLTVLFDMPPEEGLKRACLRVGENDRLESENLNFHRTVRQGFLAQAEREPGRIKIVNALGSVKEVNSRLWETVQPCLQAWERDG